MIRLGTAGRSRELMLVERSPLRRADPRTKLALSLCASLAVMLPLQRLLAFMALYLLLLAWARLLPEAARQVWRLKWVLLILFAVVGIFGWSYSVLMPAYAVEVLKVGEAGLGNLNAAIGIGALIGSLVVGVADGEHFIASDASPLAGHADRMVNLADHEVAVISARQRCAIRLSEVK